MRAFTSHRAFVVGIGAYAGAARLTTPVPDAEAVARTLREAHGFHVQTLVDADASLAGLRSALAAFAAEVGPDDRVVLYFAGHGLAQDGDDGPQGYLVPCDGVQGQPDTLLPMAELNAALEGMACRHLLLVLDCCFAGSFRWSGSRNFIPAPPTVYRNRYERFVGHPAWQVITSASDDQTAADSIRAGGLGRRVEGQAHSPFALALMDALGGAADSSGAGGEPDGVITATELYLYLRDHVEVETAEHATAQTPGLWPLRKHGRGEFLFHVPGADLVLKDDPRLDVAANPWRGLQAYDPEHSRLFFGRQRVLDALRARLDADTGLIAVLGASGTGKSSAVRAGLIPRLRADGWTVPDPMRPGTEPTARLDALAAAARGGLAVIDQLEEIWTVCRDDAERARFFDALERHARAGTCRLLVTCRSDFEPRLASSPMAERVTAGRYVVPALSQDELREVIEGPARERALYFEPPELVDDIVNEVHAMPGGLPMLSFALSELYRRAIADGAPDRSLRQADYAAMGGVAGALQDRAASLLGGLVEREPAMMDTARRVFLRMVATDGGKLARRRVSDAEMAPADPAEAARVDHLITAFTDARLLSRSSSADGGEAFVEPAHDTLVLSWDRMHQWMDSAAGLLPLQRLLWTVARGWDADGRPGEQLWDFDPRLPGLVGEHAPDWLNGIESAFVGASQRRERAALRRRRIIEWIGIGLAGAAAAGLVFWLFKAMDASQEAALNIAAAGRAEEDARVEQSIALKRSEEAARALENARAAQTAAADAQEQATRALVEEAKARSAMDEAFRLRAQALKDAERVRIESSASRLAALADETRAQGRPQAGLLLAEEAWRTLDDAGLPVLPDVERALTSQLVALPSVAVHSWYSEHMSVSATSVSWSEDGEWVAFGGALYPGTSSLPRWGLQWVCRRPVLSVDDCTRYDGVRAHFDPTGQYVLLDGTRAERGEGGVGMPTLYRLPDLQKVTDLPVGAGYWLAADGSAVCTGSRERIDFGSGWLRDGFEAAPPDAPGLVEVCMSGRWVPWIHPFEPVEATGAPPLSQAVGHETQVVGGSVSPDGAALVSFGRWEVRVTRLTGGDVPRPELATRTPEPADADQQAAAKENTPAPVRWDGDVLLREAADGRIVRSDLHGRELGVVPGSSLPGPFDEHQSAIPEGGGLLDDGSGVWARTDAGLELRDLSGRVQRRLSGGSYHGCEVARALPGGRFLCGSGIPMLFALWGSDGQDLKGEACPTEGTMAGGASTLLVSRDGTAGIQIKVQDWGRQPGAYVCTMNLATNPPALEERFVNSRGALAAIRDNGDHAARIVSMGNSNDFGTLELWDLRTSAWTVLRAGSAPITAVAFVGDDLVAGDGDGGIWVWRLAGGLHQLGIPLAHLGRGPIRHLVPNDAGSHLAAVVPGATVLVATARNVAAEVAVRAGRQLLPSERRAAGLPVPPDATDPSLTGAGYMDPP